MFNIRSVGQRLSFSSSLLLQLTKMHASGRNTDALHSFMHVLCIIIMLMSLLLARIDVKAYSYSLTGFMLRHALKFCRHPYMENPSGLPERTNEAAGAYAQTCISVAKECGCPVVDLWTKIQEFPDWKEACLWYFRFYLACLYTIHSLLQGVNMMDVSISCIF